MIKINKTLPIPQILIDSGITKREELKNLYLSEPNNYTSRVGIKSKDINSLEFDNSIYGHNSVKKKLIQDQFEKCCFCESKFTDNSYGDVEHFRPKTAYFKNNSTTFTYPGYYWLAYDWDNLLFSCEKCNRTYKKNHFPLYNESTRKRIHNDTHTLAGEDTLLINPLTENPSDYIIFREEVPVPINNNIKGKKTIDIFQLERMNDSRLEHLQLLEANVILAKVDKTNEEELKLATTLFRLPKEKVIELIDIAQEIYNGAAKQDAKFSYVVRCKFPELPRD